MIIPLFVAQFLIQYIASLDGPLTWDYEVFSQTIVKVSGSTIGMIPSGLFLLTSIALFKGVITLGNKYDTSVQELYCIEMLARVDTLCLDKTGTITDGTMKVVDCAALRPMKKNSSDYSIKEIIGSMMSSFEEKNATSEARDRFFSHNQVLQPIQILPFSSKRKYSAVTFKDLGTYYLGAPEFIFLNNYSKVKQRVEMYASQGCRVIALGYTVTQIKRDGISPSVIPISLIVIQDPISEEALETIKFFKEN